MKNGNDGQNAPEKVGYTRYYEHDGMLRAYANRSMVLAMVFGVIALSVAAKINTIQQSFLFHNPPSLHN